MRPFLSSLLLALSMAVPAGAAEIAARAAMVTEWKAVYGEVEALDRLPARARIGGTVVALTVSEGDEVRADQQIARIEDTKLSFQLNAIDARLEGLRSQLSTAAADLARGETLRERGVITQQRLDQLQTQVDVLTNQIRSAEADRRVIAEQVKEGEVHSPVAGRVLRVPVAKGSVISPGEVVAEIGGGGVFLRLSLPERFADDLEVGAEIGISGEGAGQGRLVKLYPLIEGGRLLADVSVEDIDSRFIGRRVPVRLPVDEARAVLVPEVALSRVAGLDFVTVAGPGGGVRRSVVPGRQVMIEGVPWREILTGLRAGERVVTPDE